MTDGKEEPIAEVKVGDKVLATDPETGQMRAEPVVQLIRHSGQHAMVLVTLADGSVLGSTEGTPSGTPPPAGSESIGEGQNSSVSDGEGIRDSGRCHSFSADTLVLLADGTPKAISKVVVGDRVWTTDPATGRPVIRTVTDLHLNDDSDLTDVTVRDSSGQQATIHTTEHHRFWDDTRHGWVDAAGLRPGPRQSRPAFSTA